MRTIPLTRGEVTLVDDWWYDRLSQREWHFHPRNQHKYAVMSYYNKVTGFQEMFYMQWVIMGMRGGVDHIDGDGLNNQECNLRLATLPQNHQNQKLRSDSAVGYKGVTLTYNCKYRARIVVQGCRIDIARCDHPIEAALAYDDAARKHFGEFARVNFPKEGERGALV
jgi:hypothetical protein